jgi:hypothetical protein
MGGLAERDLDPDAGMCAECRRRPAVGPCAACEAMICGDCGVITTDPAGRKCICASCARLVASVGDRSPRRGYTGTAVLIAVVVILAFAISAAAALR